MASISTRHIDGFRLWKKGFNRNGAATRIHWSRPVGRGMKVDRQEIIGLVSAIDIWLSTDHDKRLKEQDARYASLTHELENVNGVSCEVHYSETAIRCRICM